MSTTTVIAASDVRAVVRRFGLDALMDELIERLHDAFRTFDSHEFDVPLRRGFHYSTPVTGLIEWMPAMALAGTATIKMVGYHPSNPATSRLPTIMSSVLVFDTRTGHLRNIIDGNFLTALRTGAASAVASRLLARSDSRTLGIIGCGAQAVTQLHALSRVLPIKQVLAHDIDADALHSFPSRTARLRLPDVEIRTASPAEIAAACDVLCTCTSVDVSGGPVFADVANRKHLHINAVGSDFPGKTEVPRTFLLRSLVCPDFTEQAMDEGECQQLQRDQIGPDIAELASQADRFSDFRGRETVFDSTGFALEDHVAAEMLIERALDAGLGQELDVESIGADPKDPYAFTDVELPEIAARLAVAD